MRKVLAFAIAVVLAAIFFWLRTSSSHVAERTRVAESPPNAAPDPVSSPELVAEPGVEMSSSVPTTSRTELAPEIVAPAAPPASPPSDLVEIKGRLLQPSGAPARGAEIKVHGWQANQERVLRFGLPKDWVDPQCVSEADGTFSVRFAPPPAFQFVVAASFPGHVTASWRWHELAAGTTRDLGDVTFELAGAIAGRVVDAQGKPLAVDWRIVAEGLTRGGARGTEAPRSHAPTDPKTGEFRLDGVAPGSTRLKASGRNVNWVDGPSVDVRAGETARVDFVYSGPDLSNRISVVTFARPFYIFDSGIESIVLSAAGFEPRRATKLPRSSQTFVFEDVPAGSYTVSIDDPKFLPWSKSGVSPGEEVRAMLVGAAAIQLRVIDGDTQQPIERYGVHTRFDRSNTFPNEFEVHSIDEPPPPNGRFEGLIPVDQTITVHVPGYSVCALAITEFVAGETRALVAELRRGARIVALVVEHDGAPAASVELTLAAIGASESRRRASFGDRRSQIHARTDADGRAELSGVTAGRYRLSAKRTALVSTSVEIEVAGTGASEQRLVFPPVVWIASKLVSTPPIDFTGMTVHAEPTEMTEDEREQLAYVPFDERGARGAVAKDGSFRIGPLPVRSLSLVLSMPRTVAPTTSGSIGVEGGRRVIATIAADELERVPREIDISAFAPGSIELHVTRAGTAAAHAIVVCSSWERGANGSAAAILGEDGTGRTSALFPGRYRANVRDVSSSWQWNAPAEIVVEPGRSVRVQLDMLLVDGTVTVVDGTTRAPIANQSFWLSSAAEHDPMLTVTTDAEGRLALSLEPGRYALDPAPSVGERASVQLKGELDWTTSGPAEATVALR